MLFSLCWEVRCGPYIFNPKVDITRFAFVGFFLGRHTAEKQAAKSGTAIKNQYSDTINQLSISILKLSNLTTIFALIPSSKIGPYNYTQLYNNLHCNCNKNFLPDLEKFENNPLLTVSELITLDLNVLLECYNNASRFLEGILSF